jgi:tetratricopeptide (TPR) repeat protein
MKPISEKYLIILCLAVLTGLFQSCQSDGRNSTRIPPVIKKSREQWQQDAMLHLTDLINRGIDPDLNYFKRARIYLEKEQYTQALDDINEAIYEQDNVGEYFLLRGKVNRELGKIDDALEDAQRAEALQQSSPELYILLADILQAKNRFNEAAGYLNQALKMAPYDASAYYVKGILQARQGDSLAALSSLNFAMNANPRLLRAYEQSTVINRKLKNLDRALFINSSAIKRFPDIANLHFHQGEIFVALAKPDTAIVSYQKAAQIDPTYEDALFQIADLGIRLTKYQQAIPALEKLMKIRRNSKQINNMMGFCYEKTGDYPKAKEFYSVALSLSPGDQDARYGLYRIRQRENAYLYATDDEDQSTSGDNRLLDSTRVRISPIQPRGTTNIRVDSARKAKIQ